jgi:hypothetical protein|tara:strand:- start:2951 stop:3214 length:264 start_codon:yes stop_codon:yes gene_type:complete
MSKERSWAMEWLVNQPAHWATAFVPALLILWQPLWFVWLVILFPLSREYYQHHRKVTVWRRDLWFAYAGIICAYVAYFIGIYYVELA